MRVDRDARRVVGIGETPAVRRVEEVLDALGGHTEQHDPVPDQPRIGSSGEEIGEGNRGECAPAALEVEQELVATRVHADVAAVVRFERSNRGGAEPEQARVDGIGFRRHPFDPEIEQGQPERERRGRSPAVVDEEQTPAHDPTGVDHDVVEAHPVTAREHLRGGNALGRAAAELGDDDHVFMAPQRRLQRFRPGRHRDVAVDVETNRARRVARQRLHGLGQRGVGQRPTTLSPDVRIGHGDQENSRIGGEVPRAQSQVPVVGRQLERFHDAEAPQPEDTESDGRHQHHDSGERRAE